MAQRKVRSEDDDSIVETTAQEQQMGAIPETG
jgi:hypothetical protein